MLSTTILACFYKSTLVSSPIKLPVESPDLSPLYESVQKSGHLSDSMRIENFLNPVEESSGPTGTEEELSSSALLEHLISGSLDTGDSLNDQEDDSQEPLPLPKPSEALNAVRSLISYMEGQDASKASLLRPLERLERSLESEIVASRSQHTLDSWLR